MSRFPAGSKVRVVNSKNNAIFLSAEVVRFVEARRSGATDAYRVRFGDGRVESVLADSLRCVDCQTGDPLDHSPACNTPVPDPDVASIGRYRMRIEPVDAHMDGYMATAQVDWAPGRATVHLAYRGKDSIVQVDLSPEEAERLAARLVVAAHEARR